MEDKTESMIVVDGYLGVVKRIHPFYCTFKWVFFHDHQNEINNISTRGIALIGRNLFFLFSFPSWCQLDTTIVDFLGCSSNFTTLFERIAFFMDSIAVLLKRADGYTGQVAGCTLSSGYTNFCPFLELSRSFAEKNQQQSKKKNLPVISVANLLARGSWPCTLFCPPIALTGSKIFSAIGGLSSSTCHEPQGFSQWF